LKIQESESSPKPNSLTAPKYKTLGFLVEMLQYSSCLFWNEYPISLNITVEVNGDINGDIKWLSVEGTG